MPLVSATVEAAVLHIPILAALLVTLYLSSSAIRRATSLSLSGGRQLSDAGLRLLTVEHVLSMWLVVMLLTMHHISTAHSLVFLSAISAEATLLCCSVTERGTVRGGRCRANCFSFEFAFFGINA